jgi:hypothetical protein
MSDTLKFVVMSDLHLVREGQTSMSLDTAARLEAAVVCLNDRYADADFVIIADTDTKKVILCIEMKMKTETSTEKKIIEQLKGAKCFATYCQKIGKEFWAQPTFLDSYVYRFVTIRNINIHKRPTREKQTLTHDGPERMLKISSPKGLQFDRLIGGR